MRHLVRKEQKSRSLERQEQILRRKMSFYNNSDLYQATLELPRGSLEAQIATELYAERFSE